MKSHAHGQQLKIAPPDGIQTESFELGFFPPTLPLLTVTGRVSRRLAHSAGGPQPTLPQQKGFGTGPRAQSGCLELAPKIFPMKIPPCLKHPH